MGVQTLDSKSTGQGHVTGSCKYLGTEHPTVLKEQYKNEIKYALHLSHLSFNLTDHFLWQ
jgi:hypothetical protein